MRGAPWLAAKVVPYAVLALAGYGLILAKDYHDGFHNQVLYGLVLAGVLSWRHAVRAARGRPVPGPRSVAARSRSTRRAPGCSGR